MSENCVNAKTPLSDIRGKARETILENPYAPVIITFLYFLVKFSMTACFSTVFIPEALWAEILLKTISFLVNVMLGLLVAGRVRYFTLLSEGKNATVAALFSAFRKGPDRVLAGAFILELITLLCTLPGYIYSIFYPVSFSTTTENVTRALITLSLIVGGFLVSFLIRIPFMPLYYVLGDYVNMPLSKAIRMSFWLMKGNAGRYISLCISILPLLLLGYLSLGIGFLWISPLIQSSYAHFYLDLVLQKQRNNAE